VTRSGTPQARVHLLRNETNFPRSAGELMPSGSLRPSSSPAAPPALGQGILFEAIEDFAHGRE
jgi:hypothetical protein